MLKYPTSMLALALGCFGLMACPGSESGTTQGAPGIEPAPSAPTPHPNPALPGLTDASPELASRLSKALRNKESAYTPRTHHLHPDGAPLFTNRLIEETSPYLLQHAHNPVSWYPWGEDAFARAKAEGKPVLLSIGYSTCHWCHVMEKESFEDLEIAAYINQNYIAIKVDREERPDLDSVYMTAVNLLTGRGGWPMTTVLTPDKEPFFGGTYFPPRDGARGSRKGFLTILRELRARYDADPQGVVAEAKALSQRIAKSSLPPRPGTVPGDDAIAKAAQEIARRFDPLHGGFGKAPKFPRPVTLDLMLRYHRRTGDPEALRMTLYTLKKMAGGGMYDHVAGGFHRYSVDARWLVPHFEKMLYDNAQLVLVYLDAYQLSGDPEFARVARETLDYVAREMTAPEGGFYSATDADSPTPEGHEEEGWFFTWTPGELVAVLGEERAKVVSAWYGVTPRGNFEGRNILNTPKDLKVVAASLNLTPAALTTEIEAAKPLLLAARAKRPPPLRDDKILTAWNGLMISAFARGAFVLGDERYLAHGTKAADFISTSMRGKGWGLLRTFKDGQAKQEAFLDDYAFVIQGYLDLFEASSDLKWLREARMLQGIQDGRFKDHQSGGYFFTSQTHDALFAREKPDYDGAEPSGNSVAVSNLLRLGTYYQDGLLVKAAEEALGAFSTNLSRRGSASPRMLSALDYYLDTPLEVFLVAPEEGAISPTLWAPLRQAYLPNRVVVATSEGPALKAHASVIPLLKDKVAQSGDTTAYVCEQGRCQLPTKDPKILAKQLKTVTPLRVKGGEPSKIPETALGTQPKPWSYDAAKKRHWNPEHNHWHDGAPPTGK